MCYIVTKSPISKIWELNDATFKTIIKCRQDMLTYKNTGQYGKIPIAVYSGTDAMHQLATSSDPGDREMYNDLCQFIIGSNLKK